MKEYIKIIDDDGKYGSKARFDFSVSAEVCNFTAEEMTEFRSICCVALRVADNMWIRQQETNNPASQLKETTHNSPID